MERYGLSKFQIYIVTLFAFSITTVSAKADDEYWISIANARFNILTNTTQQQALEVLTTLEEFRVASQNVIRVAEPADNTEILVILFDTFSEFSKYRPGRIVAGYALISATNPIIVMPVESRGLDALLVAKHELVHALMRNHPIRFPQWYQEGIAELLSRMEINGGEFVLGKPPKDRAFRGIKPIPFERILKDSYPTHRSTLVSEGGDPYFQYWLLTHYLLLGAPPEIKAGLAPYLESVHAGGDPVAVFEPTFGVPLRKLWRKRLRPYWKKLPLFKSTFDTGELDLNYSVSNVQTEQLDEIFARLRNVTFGNK